MNMKSMTFGAKKAHSHESALNEAPRTGSVSFEFAFWLPLCRDDSSCCWLFAFMAAFFSVFLVCLSPFPKRFYDVSSHSVFLCFDSSRVSKKAHHSLRPEPHDQRRWLPAIMLWLNRLSYKKTDEHRNKRALLWIISCHAWSWTHITSNCS